MVKTVPTNDDSLLSGIQQGQTLGVTEMASSEPGKDEEIQVAGLGNIFKIPKAAEDVKKALKTEEVVDQQLFSIKPDGVKDEQFKSIYQEGSDYISSLDIDYSLVKTPEDFDKLINDITKNIPPTGVQKDDQVRALAAELDIRPSLLQGNGFKNAEEVYAARQFIAKSGSDLIKLADELIANSTDANLALKFKQHLTLHGLYVTKFKQGRADVGRALRAFSIPQMADPSDSAQAFDNLMGELGGVGNIVDIAKKTKDVYGANGLPAVNKLIGDNWYKRGYKAWSEAYRGGLLFSVKTQLRNVIGNGLYLTYSVPEYILAGTYGSIENAVVRGAGKILPGKYWGNYKNGMTWDMGIARLYGFVEGSKDAFALAKKALMTGETSDAMYKYEGANSDYFTAQNLGLGQSSIGSAVDFMGKVFRLPYRGLIAGDEYFKEVARSMEMHSLLMENANIIARTQNISFDKALLQATEEVMSNPGQFQKQLDEAARYYTFQDQLPKSIEKLTQGVQDFPFFGTIVLPFAKTPVNVTRRFLDLTTGGILDRRVLTDPKYRSKVVARITMFSMFASAVSGYYQEGRITGGYPLLENGKIDMKAKAALDAVNWKPYSFVFAGDDFPEDMPLFKNGNPYEPNGNLIYVAYNGMEPIGALFGVVAHANELMQRAKDPETRDNIAMALATSMHSYLSEMPMLSAMSDAMGIFEDRKYTQFVKDNLANLVLAPVAPLQPITGFGNILGGDVKRDTSVDFERDLQLYKSSGFKKYQKGDEIPDGKKVGDFVLDEEGNKIEKIDINFNYGGIKGDYKNVFIETFNQALYKFPYDEGISLGEQIWGKTKSGQDLPPQYDIFGNELKKTSGRGLITDITNTFINPFTIVDADKKGSYVYENIRLGNPISNPKNIYKGVKLKPQEYADLIVFAKQTKHRAFGYLTFEEYIAKETLSYRYLYKMNDNEKYKHLQKINAQAFEFGRELLLTKYPELAEVYKNIKQAQDMGELPVGGANIL